MPANRPQFALAESSNLHSIDLDAAARRLHQARQMPEQHGLSAARTAEDRHGFAAKDIQIDATQDFIHAKLLGQPPDADVGFGHLVRKACSAAGIKTRGQRFTVARRGVCKYIVRAAGLNFP